MCWDLYLFQNTSSGGQYIDGSVMNWIELPTCGTVTLDKSFTIYVTYFSQSSQNIWCLTERCRFMLLLLTISMPQWPTIQVMGSLLHSYWTCLYKCDLFLYFFVGQRLQMYFLVSGSKHSSKFSTKKLSLEKKLVENESCEFHSFFVGHWFRNIFCT